MIPLWALPIFCVFAYALGHVNFSIIISKLKGKDIRTIGSGNPGATNMKRAFGLKWALVVLVLDMSKSVVPALLGVALFGGMKNYDFSLFGGGSNTNGLIGLYSMGFAAVLGTCFPVLSCFSFKKVENKRKFSFDIKKISGGKGVSATMGVFTVANPLFGLISLFVCIIFGGTYIQCVSIVSFSFLVVNIVWNSYVKNQTDHLAVALLFVAFFVLIMFTHRSNIKRLLQSKERKVSILKSKK
jgi:glycerol-3-phosphate acyltransferase PlsY